MKKVLKGLFLENIWMKLLSIALAILAWCGIMNMSDPNIRVTIRNINVTKENEDVVASSGMIYDIAKGDNISVTLSGPRSIVQKLTYRDIDAYVDLTELSRTNACPIHVNIINSHNSSRIEIVEKSEDVMILKLENMVTTHKPIQIELLGKSEGMYAIAEANPLLVEVYASETMVDTIDKFVGKIDISDKTSSFTETCNIRAYSSSGEVIDSTKFNANINSTQVNVTMLHTKVINVTVDADITCEYGFASGTPVQAPATVEIAASSDVLSTLTDIVIPYKETNVKETINANININDYLPEGCHLVSDVDKISLTVPVMILDVDKDIDVSLNSIVKSGLDNSLRITNLDDLLKIKIWGAEGQVEELTADDLGLYVDLKDIKVPGTYNVPLNMKNDYNLLLDDVTISVNVEKVDIVGVE